MVSVMLFWGVGFARNPDALRCHPTPLDRYAARVRHAACQYRPDCAILSEVSVYAKLKSERQRAMRELVTGEYWRMIAVRDAPHKEPIAS